MLTDHPYHNPTPVAVIPVSTVMEYEVEGISIHFDADQVVYIRRNIEPQKCCLALPGCFVNEGERIESGGRRELKEETGLDISEEDFQLFRSEITPKIGPLFLGLLPAIP